MRVSSARTTRCWGFAAVLVLSLPHRTFTGAFAGQQVPAPPASAPPPTQAPATPATAQSPTQAPTPTPIAAPPTQTPSSPAVAKPAAPPYAVAWTSPIDTDDPLTLVLTSSSLIVSGPNTPMRAHAVDDGHVKWTAATGSDDRPVVEDGLIFSVTGGRLTAIDEASGALRWSVVLEGNTLGPATQPGVLLIASGTSLFAYRTTDGSGLWSQDVGVARTRPAVSGKLAVIGLADGTFAGIDLQSGQRLWREPADIAPTSLVAAGDHFYVGTEERSVCAFKQLNGRLAWCFPVRVPSVGEPVV